MVGGAPGVAVLLCTGLDIQEGAVVDGVSGLEAQSPDYGKGSGRRENGAWDKRVCEVQICG